ncbi:hypothetical protein [Agrobacterium tumefaciens]|uniref:Uncharacterized protein n=1 Tax=Agrobacterium tumefaciens TaxID=358 RepID=A0AA44J7X3_AGRTU|nr:hypothetical protein [Agrobacterium tumefaciens]NSL20561.1 hypothetical protein [Agrobacterium tumefaciens]NTB85024.1 hypothetical protein [Agrobacterium tumefaciens]NTC15555.1 hypothetical protein [Agrobacterium tumefaciens]NTC28074.1 hypothetical protein [Agrobacterium tumefaciens]NTC54924.1 hypothetical protein [Agrobacterium tumefaciens]
MKTYDVLRQHLGDKMYMPGDIREVAPGDVQHLIDNGVLREAKAKSEPTPSNKAEKAAPKNKSA